MTKPFFLILMLSPLAGAQGPRTAIESLYQRSARAASYKFYPTLMAYRAPDYQAFAPDGARLDLSNEVERYAMLFASAISVRLQSSILEFVRLDDRHCRCRVAQQMTITRPKATTQLRTVSQDEWERGRSGWRLHRRRLLQQAYQDPN